MDMTSTVKGAITGGWNGGPVRGQDATILDALERCAREQPDALAIEVPATGEFISYGELVRRVRDVAVALRIYSGRVVAVRMDRELGPLIQLLGVMSAGAIPLAVDIALPTERVVHMLHSANAVDLDDIAPRSLGENTPAGAGHRPDIPAGTAYLVYTSGSSGRPKGVFVPQAGLANAAYEGALQFGLTPGRRLLHTASWSFDAAWWEFTMTLIAGAVLVVAPLEDLEKYVTDGSVDAALLTPTVASWIADAALHLDTIGLGGEAPSNDLVRRLRRSVPHVLNCYGPAEASICVAITECDPTLKQPAVGAPIHGVRAYVLDDSLKPVQPGDVGELHLAGVCVGLGYLGSPEQTSAAFIPDLLQGPEAVMYRTGDLAYISKDGIITILGRKDSQVKIRGVRIELGEIEAFVRELDGVLDCCATYLADQDVIGLIAVPAAGMSADLNERIVKACRERLHDAMVPRVVRCLETLPTTSSLKVARDQVADLLRIERHPEADRSISRRTEWSTPMEYTVAILLGEVCPVSPTSPEDTFFSCGGTSLDAARVAAALRSRLGVRVTMADIMGAGTVPAIAHLAETSAPLEEASLILASESPDEPAPTSSDEARLWHLWRMDSESSAYVVPTRLRFDGVVDTQRLAWAVGAVAERHPQLRARYEEGADGSIMRWIDVVLPPIQVIDLTDVEGTVSQAELLLEKSRITPFDLRTGPLVRSCIVRTSPESVVLALDIHHIVTDGTSTELLIDQILAAYADGVLPPPGGGYESYVRLQRQALSNGRQEKLAQAWQVYLEGAPDYVELPFTHPPQGDITHSVLEITRLLPSTVTDRLTTLAAQTGSSLFHVLLSTLGAQIGKLTGRDEVLIAALRGDRPTQELEATVGFFISTVPVRVCVKSGATVSETLARVRNSTLAAFELSDLPFEQIVKAVSPRRIPGSTPLVQVALNLVALAEPSLSYGNTSVTVEHQLGVDSKFDVTVYAHPGSNGLKLRLAFRTDLIPRDWADELADQFVSTLKAMAERTPSAAFPGLESPARRLLAAQATRTLDCGRPSSVVERVRRHALVAPYEPAVEGRQTITRSDLQRLIVGFREALASLEITPGHIVAVVGRRNVALPVAVLGLLESGIAFSLVDLAQPEETRRDLLDALRPTAVVDIMDQHSMAPQRIILDDLGDVRAVRHGIGGTSNLLGPEVAYIAHTSGTTGRPKQIHATAESFDHQVAWETRLSETATRPRGALASGIAYDPCLRDLLVPLATGGVLIIPDEEPARNTSDFARWLRATRVSLWHTTPSLLAAVFAAAEGPILDLQLILVGGEPLPADQVPRYPEKFPNARILNVYGTTETPQVMGAFDIRDEFWPARHVPVGIANPGVRLLVLDEDDRVTAPGELGELVVASTRLALRYGSDPKELRPLRTSIDGLAEPAYRTGDLARVEPTGVVHVVGRRDQQVKVAGIRIETGPIEDLLRTSESVAAAYVRPRSATLGARLIALVVPSDPEQAEGETISLGQRLEAELRRRLPEPAVPTVLLVPEILIGSSGKVDVEATCATVLQPSGAPTEAAPLNDWQKHVAAIWEEVLGVRPTRADDDFFRMGGHSLLAARFLARLSEENGADISLKSFFTEPTLGATARSLHVRTEEMLVDLSDELDELLNGIE